MEIVGGYHMRLNTMVFMVTNSLWIDSGLHQPGQIGRSLLFDDPVQVSGMVVSHVNLHQARNTILGMQRSFCCIRSILHSITVLLHIYFSSITPSSRMSQLKY